MIGSVSSIQYTRVTDRQTDRQQRDPSGHHISRLLTIPRGRGTRCDFDQSIAQYNILSKNVILHAVYGPSVLRSFVHSLRCCHSSVKVNGYTLPHYCEDFCQHFVDVLIDGVRLIAANVHRTTDVKTILLAAGFVESPPSVSTTAVAT